MGLLKVQSLAPNSHTLTQAAHLMHCLTEILKSLSIASVGHAVMHLLHRTHLFLSTRGIFIETFPKNF